MALAHLTINLDAFTGDDRPPLSSYSTITLDPGVDHIDAAADVIHVRSIVVSLDRQGKAATANGVPCVDGKVPVVAGVAYAVSAPNVLRGGPHYVPALTAGQVVDLSDYITPGTPLTPDQAATLTARIVALEAAPPGVTDHGALTGLGDDDHPHYLTNARGDARYASTTDPRLSDARTPTAHTHPVAQVSDSTATGRALVTATDAAAARTALGLGTAATTASTAYATAAQGAAADAALPTAAAPELIRDTMATALVAGANVTITPNDGADTITIAAAGGGGGGSPAFLLPSIPGGATNPPFNANAAPNVTGYAYGTSYPWPAGVPIAGIAFNVTTAQSGATMNVGVYDCDAIGRPKTRLNLTTGIAVSTTGRKTVAFSATPTGGLLWVFFKCSTNGDVVRLSGYNNNTVSAFVAVSTSNWEAQRACKIDPSLPADAAASFAVDSNWLVQPGFHIIFPT